MDDNGAELSTLFKSSMSLAREKKISVVKGGNFVLMEQSHQLTRQLVSILLFSSRFFSFISTLFFVDSNLLRIILFMNIYISNLNFYFSLHDFDVFLVNVTAEYLAT